MEGNNKNGLLTGINISFLLLCGKLGHSSRDHVSYEN